MTNEEAIEILQGAIKKPNTKDGYLGQAIDMAIQALRQTDGDLISRKDLLKELEKWDWQDTYLPIHFAELVADLPSAEK